MTAERLSTLDAEIGAAIRLERMRAGIKQEQLATALGIDRTTLSRYEAGERSVSIPVLSQIATLLQISFANLLPAEASRQIAPSNLPASLQPLVELLMRHPGLIPQVMEFLMLVLERDALGEEETHAP